VSSPEHLTLSLLHGKKIGLSYYRYTGALKNAKAFRIAENLAPTGC
jgi:hypothetical protein